MLADRCCEIAQQCFREAGRSRRLGFADSSLFQPQTKQLNGKEKKRWERVSRERNSDIENLVLEELYEEQGKSWQDMIENYEDEIKRELVAELWNDELNESLSSMIPSATNSA
ncbi:unnamed protein product [Gongylonema pulchrum]|uniref:RPA_interact_N domain-containing protein n=1 Tax=Gongylonema pulchrum TaxID=637853 RepID=A0A183ELS8_9BILA|nr:unnamed protein product [Gongylonema pulchrum]